MHQKKKNTEQGQARLMRDAVEQEHHAVEITLLSQYFLKHRGVRGHASTCCGPRLSPRSEQQQKCKC